MGVYYSDMAGNTLPVASVSSTLDGYGWTGGWRISDNTAKTLWNANDGGGDWLFWVFPNVFVIRTSTMEIYAAELGQYPTQINVLSVVQEIDAMD